MENKKKGKGKGGRSYDDPLVKLSKKLSWLLRHGAVQEGINIGSDGFVKLDDILQRQDFKGVKLDTIQKLVQDSDKQRYELIQKKDNEGANCYFIRAVQGHSIKTINDEELLEPIIDYKQYPMVVHGTYNDFWPLIKDQGLKIMGRNHIHFAIGYPGENQVISGMRKSCDIYIELDLQNALRDGMKIFKSKNNVILSAGFNGVILPQYFKSVKNYKGQILQTNDKFWQEQQQQQNVVQVQKEDINKQKNKDKDSDNEFEELKKN